MAERAEIYEGIRLNALNDAQWAIAYALLELAKAQRDTAMAIQFSAKATAFEIKGHGDKMSKVAAD